MNVTAKRLAACLLLLLLCCSAPTPAEAFDPGGKHRAVAEVPEVESLREFERVAEGKISQLLGELAIQRGYARRLERYVDELEARLAVTERLVGELKNQTNDREVN